MTIHRDGTVYTTVTTAIGTAATDITGLAIPVVSGGVYTIQAECVCVNVGSPTNITFDCTGPSLNTASVLMWKRMNATGWYPVLYRNSFQTVTAAAAQVPTKLALRGCFITTAAGTVQLQGIRVGGTSATIQTCAFLKIQRIK